MLVKYVHINNLTIFVSNMDKCSRAQECAKGRVDSGRLGLRNAADDPQAWRGNRGLELGSSGAPQRGRQARRKQIEQADVVVSIR